MAGTLAEAISRRVEVGGGEGEAAFESPTIAQWAGELASALGHVHARKILHRDLKTANVFLTADGATKLGGHPHRNRRLHHFTTIPRPRRSTVLPSSGDFGISRAMSTKTNMAQTVCGTPCARAAPNPTPPRRCPHRGMSLHNAVVAGTTCRPRS